MASYAAHVRTARSLGCVAATLVLVGWLVVLRGLYLLPPSPSPELDLEAGPAFGLSVEVYLPSVAVTVLLAVLLVVAVLPRPFAPAAALTAAAVSGSFAFWVLTRDALLTNRPGLGGHLVAATVLSAAALVVAATAAMSARAGSGEHAPASVVPL